MLAHVPSFGRNPRGSPDFLAYPVPKACMHVLGTGVPRCLGVARSALSPKAAQALGCSLTPGLRISFGRVTCMAASVPGLRTMGFLPLCGACVWVWVVVWFWFGQRPATPGWGVGVCVRLCVRSACALPLLAGVCGVGVCGWVRVSAAPRHSWLGCRGLCLLVCALCLHPPLLAWVYGVGVCASARVSAAPRHSCLGCWGVCVLLWALRLHPATPGTGARCGCVCLGSGFGCAPPLLAGVCVVGVCTRARVSAAPRPSWRGCWAVCVLVCALRSHPATPGWGARCGCVCLGSGFGCAPPLLAGVLGCVCAPVSALTAPRHSWPGCAAWVCVLRLGFCLRPATPGWGVGLSLCSCARSACTQPHLARVRGLGVCVWAQVLAAPRHSWLGCCAVYVLVCALHMHPATPGWAARCGCVCLGSGFGCAPPILVGVFGCVCAHVRAPLAPRQSWHGCAVWVCVFGPGFRLRPATPGFGVGVCVRWCGRSACTPPLLAGVRAVGVRVWARVFGCAPPLLVGVLGCLCAGVGAPLAPCHSWLGFGAVDVCVWAWVSAAPRHSWLGCWAVCVLVWALCLHSTNPGWGARRGCVCLGSGFGCAPPILAGVLGCVCAGVRAPYPTTPGWGVRCGCVCLGSGFGCALPLLAGMLGCVCAGVRAPPVPRLSWLGCAAWVCVLRLGFWLRPPHLAGLLGCVCARVRALLVPCHSLLGCAVWVCVFGLGFRLRPATPGWGVGLCVCSCARYACTPPLLAGVRGLGVCAWARVSAAPRHSWLGCWAVCLLVCVLRLHPATPGTGARCVCVCLGSGFGFAPPLLAGVCVVGVCARAHVFAAPRHSWLGFVVFGLAIAWHQFVCRGSLRVVRALRVCATWRPSLLGTCLCALVVAGGEPLWRASWPAWCAAPRPVRSVSVLWSASLSPWCLSPPLGLAPPALLGGCAGHAEATQEPGSLCLRLAPAKAGALDSLRVVPVQGPAMGLSLAGPSGVGLGLCGLRWLACVDPATDASGFPDCPSFDGGLSRCIGAVSCGRRHRKFSGLRHFEQMF